MNAAHALRHTLQPPRGANGGNRTGERATRKPSPPLASVIAGKRNSRLAHRPSEGHEKGQDREHKGAHNADAFESGKVGVFADVFHCTIPEKARKTPAAKHRCAAVKRTMKSRVIRRPP